MKIAVCTLLVVACTLLGGCTRDMIVAPPTAGLSPPGELLLPVTPPPRLDSSKSMPPQDFVEAVSKIITHDSDVSLRFSKLQFWGRAHSGWTSADVGAEMVRDVVARLDIAMDDPLAGPLQTCGDDLVCMFLSDPVD